MPTTPSLESLGRLLADKRGKVGVRATARKIGISPATLSRIENGHLPDLENFRKLCQWLEIDPSAVLGFDSSDFDRPAVSVHFRNESTMTLDTASALAEMIQAAQHELMSQKKK